MMRRRFLALVLALVAVAAHAEPAAGEPTPGDRLSGVRSWVATIAACRAVVPGFPASARSAQVAWDEALRELPADEGSRSAFKSAIGFIADSVQSRRHYGKQMLSAAAVEAATAACASSKSVSPATDPIPDPPVAAVLATLPLGDEVARHLCNALLIADSPAGVSAVFDRFTWVLAQPADTPNPDPDDPRGNPRERERMELEMNIRGRITGWPIERARLFSSAISRFADSVRSEPETGLQSVLVQIASAETLRATVGILARSKGSLQDRWSILRPLATLPADAPLDLPALQAALPPPLDESSRSLLIGITIRRNRGEAPWNLPPAAMTQAACEATRETDRADVNYCFGIRHLGHEILDACLAYPIDWDKACRRAPRDSEDSRPLALAIAAHDETAIRSLLKHGVHVAGTSSVARLIAASARLTGGTERCAAYQRGCQKTTDLAWVRRMLALLLDRGAGIDEPASTSDPMTSFMAVALGRLGPAWPAEDYRGSVPRNALLASREILAMLRESGADVNATVQGCTALDYASFSGGPSDMVGGEAPHVARVSILTDLGGRRTLQCAARHRAAQAARSLQAPFVQPH